MSTNRARTDANRNFVPDCDLLNPVAQDNRATGGDFCGAFSSSTFGTDVLTANYDPGILRFGRVRSSVGVDVFNVLNSAAVLSYSQTYNPATTTWLTPTSVLSARFARISAQVDF